jgi:hypothetical protein
LGARFGVQAPEQHLAKRSPPRSAVGVDAGIKRWETAKEQVNTRRKQRLFLPRRFCATGERTKRKKTVSGALGLGALAVREEGAGQFRKVSRIPRGLFNQEFQGTESGQ